MKYLVTFIGVLVALAFMALSAAINWRYGSSMGRDPTDQLIYASVSLAADLAKAITPFFFWFALKHRNWGPAVASALFWLACTGYSLASAAGFAELSRSAQTGTLTTKKASYHDLKAELERKQTQLAALGAYQPPTVIAGRIDALKQNPRYSSSRQCTDTTTSQSRALCADIATLESERQKGLNAARLETEIDALRTRVLELAPASGIEGGDPRAGFLTRIFGWDILKVQTGFALLFIAVLELGSGLGLFIALAHGELASAIKTGHLPAEQPAAPRAKSKREPFWKRAPKAPAPPPEPIARPPPQQSAAPAPAEPFAAPTAPVPAAPGRAAPDPRPAGNIAKFARARLTAEDGAKVSFADLYAAYETWCAAETVRALPRPDFVAGFTKLCDQVGFQYEATGCDGHCLHVKIAA
ncbi:primase-like DNA-binding domain-containing protein [Hyphomicrobium sp. MC8b]|uniref:primase-like DNA-binding domain-containing protein n=1 Tax=Hyphomicrobium sp. MC8b TaxID=300273 RepID=UPI00391D23A5